MWKKISICIAVLVSLHNNTVAQTWTQIGNWPHLRCAYFWDTKNGVVAGDSVIACYKNGSWLTPSMPEPTGVFNSLRLLNDTLYAGAGKTRVWFSTDRGVSWSLSALPAPSNDVYLDNSGRVHNLVLGAVPGGTTFARLRPGLCAIVVDDGSPIVEYSTDDGATWLKPDPMAGGGLINSGFNITADTCRGLFYVLNESGRLFTSKDGNTWRGQPKVTPRTEDVFTEKDGVVFEQETGVYRSVDDGFTWTFIGGPSLWQEDSRLFAFGPGAKYLIAYDSNTVWLCSDANKGTAFSSIVQPIADTFVLRQCDTTRFKIVLDLTEQCSRDTFYIDSILISSDFPLLNNNLPRGPQVAPFSDTLWFSLTPNSLNQPSVGTITVKMHHASDTDRFILVKQVSVHPQSQMKPVVLAKSSYRFSGCGLKLFPLVLRSPDCGTWHIDSIECYPPEAQIKLVQPVPTLLARNSTDTIWVDVSSASFGAIPIQMHVYATSIQTGLHFDTLATTTLNIDLGSSKANVSAQPSVRIASCRPTPFQIYFRGAICDSIVIQSCQISGSSGVQWSFDSNFPRFISAGDTAEMTVNISNQHASGNYNIRLHITGLYRGSKIVIDTTLSLSLIFGGDEAVLSALFPAYYLDTVRGCSSRDTLVTFQNPGCDTLTITSDASQWQGNWGVTDPSFPVTLLPDSALHTRVHFTPLIAGSSTQFIQYKFDAAGKSGLLSDQVRLDAIAVSSPGQLALQSTSTRAGSFSFCSGDTTLIDTLRNIGCDTLMLKGASISGDASFTLVDNTPQFLAKDSVCVLHVRFAPRMKGVHTAQVQITWDSGGTAVGAHHAITGVGLPGTKWLAAKDGIATRDFGTLYPCESRDTTITFVNPGCDTLIVDTASVSSQAWMLALQGYPINIPANGELTVPIHFVPDTIGAPTTLSGTLRVSASNSDSAKEIDIPFVARIVYPEKDTLRVVCAAPGAHAGAGETVRYYLVLSRSGAEDGALHAISFSITNDDDLLSLEDATGLHLDSVGAARAPHTTRYYTLSPIPAGDTISVLTYKVYLAAAESTAIHIGDVSFTNTLGLPNDCVASIATIDSSFTYIDGCSDTLVRDMMMTGHVRIDRIVPNPSRDFVGLWGSGFGVADIQVYDVMGRRVARGPESVVRDPEGELELDVRALPEGVYYLRAGQARARFEIIR